MLLDKIPPQVRGALATLIAAGAAALGYTLTEQVSGAIVVGIIWLVGGIVDVVREGKR